MDARLQVLEGARRLEIAISNQDARKYKNVWLVIYFSAVICNIVSAILDGISTIFYVKNKKIEALRIATIIGQFPLAVTCAFLIDGFRRLGALNLGHLIVTKQTIVLHLVAFGSFFVASVLIYWQPEG